MVILYMILEASASHNSNSCPCSDLYLDPLTYKICQFVCSLNYIIIINDSQKKFSLLSSKIM